MHLRIAAAMATVIASLSFPAFADQKISQMPDATIPFTGAEVVPLLQGGINKKTSLSQIYGNLPAGLNYPSPNLTGTPAINGIPLGTAATANTGTAGNTLPLNNGGFIQTGLATFRGGLQAEANNDSTTIAIGGSALASLSVLNSFNIGIGPNAAGETTTGMDITAVGGNCLEHNKTGSRISCFGSTTLQNNTSGHDLFAGGYGSLINNTTGSFSTASGVGSLYGGDCDNNSMFGYDAGQGISGPGCGGDNSGFGRDVMGDGPVTGTKNFGASEGALNKLQSGNSNDAAGAGSLGLLTSGSYDDAYGVGSLGNYNASYSIAHGYLSCVHATTGNNLVCLGANTGPTLITGANDILVGQGIDVPTASTSNYMSLADIIKVAGINSPSTSTTSAAGTWTFASPILAPTGASTAPSYSFSSATDAGLFLSNSATHAVRLVAGVASLTSSGAAAQVQGGPGGATSGNAGAFSGLAGVPIDGNGANSNLIASSGATITGADRNGGSNNITAGNAVNNGTPGNITLTAGNSPAGITGGIITLSPGTSATGTQGYTVITSTVLLTGYLVSTLPSASTHNGQIARIYDALSPVWGSAPTGGGSEEVLAVSNGSSWIVR
jgi:hypothetical protein